MTESSVRPPVRRGLGRGLGALIPSGPPVVDEGRGSAPAQRDADWIGRLGAEPDTTTAVQPPAPSGRAGAPDDLGPVDGAAFAHLPLDAVRPNPRQPRQVFDEDALAELVGSIKAVGLLQPVVVRPVGDDHERGFELIMGERRWRAAREAGMTAIPAIIRDTGDDAMLRDALLENLHRAQLNPLEEAAAYQQLLEDFGCTHEELAARIGCSRPQISNTLRLLRLSPPVQRRVAAGVLSSGHARALLALPDAESQDRMATRVVAEGLSVRGLEELLAAGAGEDRPLARRPRAARDVPEATELAAALGDRLDTRVRIDLGRTRGRITIDVAGLEDLRRVAALLLDATGLEVASDAG